MLKGQTLAPMPDLFRRLFTTFIPDFLGGENLNITALAIVGALLLAYAFFELRDRGNKRAYGFEVAPLPFWILKVLLVAGVVTAFTYQLARHRGIPMVLVLLGALVLIYSFITRKTVFGRHVYAFGGNEKAAKLSGIDTNKVFFLVYANMGLMAGVAGLAFMGRLNAASPLAGINFELDAIGACFIGGASASGGIGTVTGAIIGGLIMGVLNNGMSIVGVSIDWQQVVKGLVLLAAVAFDVYTKKKTAK
jgi:putative multiple sugar transport system permease protein